MKFSFKNWVIRVLMLEARFALARRRPRIIAITGTVGKTGTKDAIFCALAPFFSARKSEKSYNSDFGVPLTILGLSNPVHNPFLWIKNLIVGALRVVWPEKKLEWLVLEVGAGEPGDIRKFANMLSPDIAVITRFADVPVHIEFFSSPEAVIAEKTQLVRAVREGGMLILNADDEKVRSIKSAFPNKKAVLFGTDVSADVRGTDYEVLYEAGLPVGNLFRILAGTPFAVSIKGVLGRHLMQPILAAFAVTHALELDPAQVAEGFQHFTPPPGRMRLIKGLNNSLIIDDSYNASPLAMREALATLHSLESKGRKIAVLGGMAELGTFSEEEHRKILDLATRCMTNGSHPCEKVIVVGELWKTTGSNTVNQHFKTSEEAADALARDIRALDVVLVKGSQSMRMEHIVKALMRDTASAPALLVRQEKEWVDR